MGKSILQWILISKLKSTCNETGNEINIGEEILYIPGNRQFKAQVFCSKSKSFYKATSPDESHMTGYKNNPNDQ